MRKETQPLGACLEKWKYCCGMDRGIKLLIGGRSVAVSMKLVLSHLKS